MGKGFLKEKNDLDLIEKWPEEQTVWLNIYKDLPKRPLMHSTKEEADKVRIGVNIGGRIACKKITFTEGDFDD